MRGPRDKWMTLSVESGFSWVRVNQKSRSKYRSQHNCIPVARVNCCHLESCFDTGMENHSLVRIMTVLGVCTVSAARAKHSRPRCTRSTVQRRALVAQTRRTPETFQTQPSEFATGISKKTTEHNRGVLR